MTNWRQCAAWASLFCGIFALFAGLVAGAHSDQFSNRLHDPWFGWYLVFAIPATLLGLILGAIGRESPRTLGLILSGSILLVLFGCLSSA
jgi:hypothetical protein